MHRVSSLYQTCLVAYLGKSSNSEMRQFHLSNDSVLHLFRPAVRQRLVPPDFEMWKNWIMPFWLEDCRCSWKSWRKTLSIRFWMASLKGLWISALILSTAPTRILEYVMKESCIQVLHRICFTYVWWLPSRHGVAMIACQMCQTRWYLLKTSNSRGLVESFGSKTYAQASNMLHCHGLELWDPLGHVFLALSEPKKQATQLTKCLWLIHTIERVLHGTFKDAGGLCAAQDILPFHPWKCSWRWQSQWYTQAGIHAKQCHEH